MAIVETITASNGVVCRIHDDLYADVPEEEINRRRERFYEVASRIAMRAAQRAAEAKAQEHKSRG